MDKRYDHTSTEAAIYTKWEESGGFKPVDDPKAEPFTIIMPPPNANDPLHIGHAMFVAIEDILIRFERMRGKAALWQPGTDHAGIETQFVYEKKLAKKGESRFNYDRESLYNQIWEYVQENSDTAVAQLKALGASADWTRFKFTLDPKIVSFVLETFKELDQQGLVYRDQRLVNYCTHCGTAFSELEVVHQEKNDPLYYLKYGPFTLATVRPETKFGDTAVAVHPDDKRYKGYIGKEIEVEGLNGNFTLKVIADEYVDPEFGTGVVKITPYHDPNDFEVWQRHKDEMPDPVAVIGFDGKLNEHTGPYAGLKVEKARQVIAEDLEKRGLIEKIDKNYTHNVGTCYRCGRVLEPLPLPQFFIKVKPLTEKVLEGLENKEVKVHGAGYDKVLRHWLSNLKDWNVSRQIVWGIRLPVWYRITEESEIRVRFIDTSKEVVTGKLGDLLKEHALETIKAGLQSLQAPVSNEYVISTDDPGEEFIQDTDTFDTWFSSSQWPFVTLKANSHEDFERFYPTSVMETAYDILMFWVMRMLMMGYFKTDQAPFKHVYLHGLIRDQKGQKMSKSKGNVINPLDIIEKYGADALRMALVIRSTPGLDKNVGEQDIRAMRNFTNKIWNATRYVLFSLEKDEVTTKKAGDAAFYTSLAAIANDITKQLEKFRIGLAAETVYNQFWHWYCDVVIEQNKQGEISHKALIDGLITFTALLHPFVPFVTEAIYQQIKRNQVVTSLKPDLNNSDWLMTSRWPA